MKRLTYNQSLVLVITLCWLYWIYLLFTTEMALRFDALGYKNLGLIFFENGWAEYFKAGPNREPLYPLFISLSMNVAEAFKIDFTYVQKIFQIAVLFITQLLTLKLLTLCRVKDGIKLGIVCYIGFSPALVNATFSLFSEILALPFVLGLIMLHVATWKAIKRDSRGNLCVLSFCLGFLYFLAICIKGIFLYVYPLAMLPYAALTLFALLKKKKSVWVNGLIVIFVTTVVLQVPVNLYKGLNYKYNGQYTFTNRGPGLLFGNATKRTAEMSTRQYLAHIASVPGSGVCRKIFSEKECRYASFHEADRSRRRIDIIMADIPESKREKKIYWESFKLILQNPIQYFSLLGIESLRVPFWESTRIGFVDYPVWLNKLFQWDLFSDGIRFMVSLLSLIALTFVLILGIKDVKKTFSLESLVGDDVFVTFFILTIVVSYTGLNALVSILTRYSIVLAPLYLMLIGLMLNNIFPKPKDV